MSYDYLIISPQLFEIDGGAMGGTERQIVTVAEKLASENFNVGLVHSQTDCTDKIINNVKHLKSVKLSALKSWDPEESVKYSDITCPCVLTSFPPHQRFGKKSGVRTDTTKSGRTKPVVSAKSVTSSAKRTQVGKKI